MFSFKFFLTKNVVITESADTICLLRMGLFELEVAVSERMWLTAEQLKKRGEMIINSPLLEIKAKNDALKVR